jgi:hypothetical protein
MQDEHLQSLYARLKMWRHEAQRMKRQHEQLLTKGIGT